MWSGIVGAKLFVRLAATTAQLGNRSAWTAHTLTNGQLIALSATLSIDYTVTSPRQTTIYQQCKVGAAVRSYCFSGFKVLCSDSLGTLLTFCMCLCVPYLYLRTVDNFQLCIHFTALIDLFCLQLCTSALSLMPKRILSWWHCRDACQCIIINVCVSSIVLIDDISIGIEPLCHSFWMFQLTK